MIYLDHHSTTPCRAEVVESMLPYFTERFGNSSSISHAPGREAAVAVEAARDRIAALLGADRTEIYFTSGATESNHLALLGAEIGSHGTVVTTLIEHKSVLGAFEHLRSSGHARSFVAVDGSGAVSAEALQQALAGGVQLVSIGAANGEIGTVQDLAALSPVCQEAGALLHTDAAQAAGKVSLDFGRARVDLASISAHKFYGPKGVGALYVRRGVKVRPLFSGGAQERRLRAGTVNVPGVVGMATALELAVAELETSSRRLVALRDLLWEELSTRISGLSINAPRAIRLPANLNVSFEDVEADDLMLALRNVAVSSGAACSSGDPEPSHVLAAIGMDPRRARTSIRFGLGRDNTEEQVAAAAAEIASAVRMLRGH